MPTIKNIIDQNTLDDKIKHPQSLERQEVASNVWSLFETARNLRDETHDLFRDRTLKEYLDTNVKRFIQFKRRPAYKKPWQSNLASTTPNEKLIGILSKLAMQGMEAKAMTTKEVNVAEMIKERVANKLLKHAGRKNDDDFQIILEMLEACEKGTVIGFEDWYRGDVIRREVKDQDPKTGELTFKEIKEKEWNDVRSTLVNLEDFYPGDIYVRPGCIQDMDYCFLRTIMTEDEFDAEFGDYPDADKVSTKSNWVHESTPFWKQSDDVLDDYVEVIRYFNKKTDEYVILANQIWINAKGKKEVSPLPWNHKKLPFWGAVFEPFDVNFFWGRSLIDKLAPFTDAKDGMLDRMLDQATLAISRPVISDGKAASAMTKGFLQPNNVIVTDWSQGRPNFDILPIPDVPNSSVQMYQILQDNLEQTGITSEVLGGRSTKKKTATEIEIQQQGAQEMVSLFLKLMEKGIRDKNRLRFANLLQFYTLPSNEKEQGLFKQVILRNEKLTNGQQGTIKITVVPKESQNRVMQQAREAFEPTEVIEISPKTIRSYEMEIDIVPQSSIKMSPAQRQILELNYQRVMTELYPDMFNRDYGFDQLNVKFDKDPQQARKIAAPEQQMGMEQGMTPMPTPTPKPAQNAIMSPTQGGRQAVRQLANV